MSERLREMLKSVGREIERAVTEERERLAKLVESEIDQNPYDDWDLGFNAGIRCALARIRNGGKP